MRILVLNSESELYNNGADKILLLTVEALTADHDIEVVLPLHGPLVGAIGALGVPCSVRRYAIMRRRLLNPFYALAYCVHLVLSTFWLWRYVRRRNIDLVYSNSLGVLEGCVMRLFTGPSHVVHIHDMVDRPAIVNRALSWLVAHGADKAICVSQAVRDHLPVQRDNLHVIWNGIPPVTPAPVLRSPTDVPVVGVVGRFNRLKGQIEMVRAAALLRDMGVDFRVRLVGGCYRGDDSFRRSVAELIAHLDLDSVVSIEDSVTDVGAVYDALDLVVVPSILLDPFPTVALEAMSAARPVVAYASGGLPEMLGFDSDCLAPRGNTDALARLVGRCLTDQAHRARLARRQHARYLEHYTLERYRERIRAALPNEPAAGGSVNHDCPVSIRQ